MSLIFYVIDVETNGLSTQSHEINEISIVRVSDRVQLFKQVICEHPENSNFDALKITGKTLEDLKQGEPKEDVVAACNDFFALDKASVGARCIIGHNVAFDRRFCQTMWEKVGQEFPANLWLDTIHLTKEWLKNNTPPNIIKTATGKVSTQLHACCDMLGVKKLTKAHASKVDSRNTYLLWMKLLEANIDYLPFIKTHIHSIKKEELDFNFDDIEAV